MRASIERKNRFNRLEIKTFSLLLDTNAALKLGACAVKLFTVVIN